MRLASESMLVNYSAYCRARVERGLYALVSVDDADESVSVGTGVTPSAHIAVCELHAL
jgi:hypothetical protein